MNKVKVPEPISFDSEYLIYEKVETYDSDKDTIEYDSDHSTISEKNDKDKKDLEFIEECNNNYSFIKPKKTKKAQLVKKMVELEEEGYISD